MIHFSTVSNCNVKSFPRLMDPQGGTDLHFCSPQSDTSLCCETRYEANVSHGVPVTLELSLVLILPTHKGMASLGGWLHIQMVGPPENSHPSQ